MTHPRGYWQDWENVKREGARIVAKFGTLPSCRVLERNGYAAFVRGTTRHWGGLPHVAQILGILDGKASNGHWKPGHWTEATFEQAIKAIIERYGTIPPKHWLARDGYPSTIDRLIRERGGYERLRKAYGLPEWEAVYPPWVQRGGRR